MKQMYKYLIKRLLSFIWGINVDLSLLNHTVIPHSFFFKEQWDYFHSIAPFKISTSKTRVLQFAHTCAKGSYIILPLGTERGSTLFLPAGLSPQITNQSSGIDTKIKPNQFALKWPIWPGSFLRGGSVRSPSMEDAGQAVVAVLKPSKTLTSAWYTVTFKRT